MIHVEVEIDGGEAENRSSWGGVKGLALPEHHTITEVDPNCFDQDYLPLDSTSQSVPTGAGQLLAASTPC